MKRAWLAAVLLAACTDGGNGTSPVAEPTAGPGGSTPALEPIEIPVVVSGRADDLAIADSILDGISVAQERLAGRGMPVTVTRLEGDLDAAIESSPPVVLWVGDATPVEDARATLERERLPVLVLGDDLYTPRQLHRYVFQTSVPVRWQARVLAGYLLEDRRAEETVIVADPADREWVAEAFAAAFAEEGGASPSVIPRTAGWERALRDAAGTADAVVALVPPGVAVGIGNQVTRFGRERDPPLLVLGSASLSSTLGDQLPEGTGVVYPYTWAGWADMLQRVRTFRRAIAGHAGHPPGGLEQEGFDALMAVADAVERAGGTGGDDLVRALEGFRDETYSSLPIRLGPDDHVFAEESHLGVLVEVEPGDVARPGEAYGSPPLAPLMRTFTTDGEKVNLLDRDKKVFFPFWHRKRPTPKYPRSEFGIVTRPGEDPVF